MSVIDEYLDAAAQATGIAVDDMRVLAANGERTSYAPGAWLFHESAPRQWLGIIGEGQFRSCAACMGHKRSLRRSARAHCSAKA